MHMRIRAQKAHAERVRVEAAARQEERKRQMERTERETQSERGQSVSHTTQQPAQPLQRAHMSVKQAVADLMAEAFFDPKVCGSIRTCEVADACVWYVAGGRAK